MAKRTLYVVVVRGFLEGVCPHCGGPEGGFSYYQAHLIRATDAKQAREIGEQFVDWAAGESISSLREAPRLLRKPLSPDHSRKLHCPFDFFARHQGTPAFVEVLEAYYQAGFHDAHEQIENRTEAAIALEEA